MKTLLLIIALVALARAADPTAPDWPSRFSQTFNEDLTYPIIGTGKTSGTLYYDWAAKRYRVDRDNGKWDRYCGTIFKFTDTPCSHIVVEGKRYLHFPDKNYCCMCCTDVGGCGLLKPDWMSGAVYEGEIIDEDTQVKLQVFNNKGLQDNRVFYDEATGHMTRIAQGTNDDQKYSVDSFNTDFADSILSLPAACDPNKQCSKFSICGALNVVQSNLV